ncbi:MAG: GNAT family N-acetyltransferase [Candidatus Heimdallarchaeota archaeon]|nr:GNAT family N-acetyltransferase [Candidatus Heimdallarchaeota archaeon]MDH5645435.1 GNAT family N-acetyltransferase [Candidatus Heimdallarchaeota archaeon]
MNTDILITSIPDGILVLDTFEKIKKYYSIIQFLNFVGRQEDIVKHNFEGYTTNSFAIFQLSDLLDEVVYLSISKGRFVGYILSKPFATDNRKTSKYNLAQFPEFKKQAFQEFGINFINVNLTQIYTLPRFRRKNLGKKIISQFILSNKLVKDLYFFCEQPNDNLLKFFKKFGLKKFEIPYEKYELFSKT